MIVGGRKTRPMLLQDRQAVLTHWLPVYLKGDAVTEVHWKGSFVSN